VARPAHPVGEEAVSGSLDRVFGAGTLAEVEIVYSTRTGRLVNVLWLADTRKPTRKGWRRVAGLTAREASIDYWYVTYQAGGTV
jgi:hypothetical protein